MRLNVERAAAAVQIESRCCRNCLRNHIDLNMIINHKDPEIHENCIPADEQRTHRKSSFRIVERLQGQAAALSNMINLAGKLQVETVRCLCPDMDDRPIFRTGRVGCGF
jgi:hypothetical protein